MIKHVSMLSRVCVSLLAIAVLVLMFALTVRADDSAPPADSSTDSSVVSDAPPPDSAAETGDASVSESPSEEGAVEASSSLEEPAAEPAPPENVAPPEEELPAEEATAATPSEEAAPAPVAEETSSPVLSTDKEDYHPGQIATIIGSFFKSLTSYVVRVFGSDENNTNYTETKVNVTTDENGSFSFGYQLDSLYRPIYELAASTLEGVTVAQSYFRDSSIGTYDQCANDDGDGYATGDTGCDWTNGNIQANNSVYFEGDSTVQRLWIEGYNPGSAHTVTFKYGTTKGGSHAYDYLTTWSASENWVTIADRCQDITGCTAASESTAQMQDDSSVPNTIEPSVASRLFTIRGGTISNVSVPTIVSGAYAGDSETSVTVSFVVGPSTGTMCTTKKVQGQDMTSCGIALWFGAHVAKSSEWNIFNGTTGAGSIQGSPYHVALDKEDNASVGQRDNQMQSAAVVQNASITIIKDAVPNDPQDFTFTTTGTGLSGFSLDDDSNGTLSNTRVFNGLAAGTYSVTEGAVSGWTQTSATCSDGSPVTAINLSAGENVTCTFVNTLQTGHIIVVKDAVPNDAQNFTFTNNFGNGNPGTFDLDDDSDGTLLNSRDSVVTAGTYSVSEGVVSGWTQTSATCSDGSPINAVQVSAGETVTCTFTNTKSGHIVVDKITDPSGSSQSFSFDASGGSYADFSLTDAAAPNDQTLVPGNYSLAEGSVSGWAQTSATCVSSIQDNETPGSLELDPGETITCTFTNTKQGKIIIEKQTLPNGSAQSFEFDTNYGANVFLTDGQQNNSGDLNPGTYSVDELTPSGWDETSAVCDDGSPVTAIDLDAGETVTCVFTNTQRGHIIVDKVTDPSDDPQSFDFTTTGAGYAGFSLTDAASPNDQEVVPGSYSVSETVPTGWDQTSATCVSSIQDTEVPGALELDPGETITCTFTNQKDAHIVVVKQTLPNGDPQSFDFSASYDLDGFALTDDQSNDSGDLDPGTYSVSETVPAGWDQESATCDDGSDPATIDLDAGETVTCTFTNEKDAFIIVDKVTDPSGDLTEFDFTSDYGPSFTLADASAPNNSGDLDPGTYSVSEAAEAGWDPLSATCSDGSDPSAIDLDAGETVTCTFTNQKDSFIVIEKQTLPNGSAQSFEFDTNYGANGFLTDGQQNNSGDLNPGTYSVDELTPSGWDETSAVCDDGSPVTAIDLDAGETVTCVFTNTQRGSITIVKDAVPNDAQDFEFSFTGQSNFFLDDDATVVDPPGTDQPNSAIFNNLAPGSYTASETLPNPFWQLGGVSCTGNATVPTNVANGVSITLNPGEHITCTFTNNKLGPTRTQGFWQTHTAFTSSIFALPVMQKFVGVNATPTVTSHKGTITNILSQGQSQLFGAFWSNIAQKTSGKRTDVDKTRMQLLQQLVTAKLNCAAFGCPSSITTTIGLADAAYAAGTIPAMLTYAGQLDAYNNSGDTVIPTSFTPGKATPKDSQNFADKVFWNAP